MYNDKDKQKEANRIAAKRYRDRKQGMTQGQINEGMTRTRTEGCKVAIPGDYDYVGVCQKIDGRWQVVKPDPIAPKDMSRIELHMAIRAYPHDQWINSPEHKELLRRLNVMSVEELEAEGYQVPAWKKVG